MAWRLAAAILLPGSAITALVLASSSASTFVSPILVGWYCALTILIAACLAINYFAGRWAEREYDRALPDSIWWGVAWRTGLVALPFLSLAVSALSASPVPHRWAWALAGVSGAAGLSGSLLMVGWSTARMVHRSLRAPAPGPAEEPSGWFHDVPVPTALPFHRLEEPEAKGVPHATPAIGQTPVRSPATGVAPPRPARPHNLSELGHPTHPAGAAPAPEPRRPAPEPVPQGRSPATQDPRPDPFSGEHPLLLTSALDSSLSVSARPPDAPPLYPSDPAPLSLEAQSFPAEQEPLPKGPSPASPPGRPTPIPVAMFHARFWQNIVGGWELEISYGSAGSSEAKRRVVFRTDRKPRPWGVPPGGFYSRRTAEEFAKAKVQEGFEILALNQMVRRAPRYRFPGGFSARLDPLGETNLQDLSLLGACTEHEGALAPGQEVRFAMDLPGRRVCASAQVVWSAPAGGKSADGDTPARFRSGIRFLSVRPEDLLNLQDYLGNA